MNRIASLLSALTLAASWPALAQGQDEAFQGLKWGDSVSAIQKRFPAAQLNRLPQCEGERFGGSTSNISCMAVQVQGYAVAGLDFEVTFFLNHADQVLAEVGLSILRFDVQAPFARNKCYEVQGLLSERYGPGRVTMSIEKEGSPFHRSVRWDDTRGATNVHLQCFGGRSTSMTIGYRPKVSLDSNKL